MKLMKVIALLFMITIFTTSLSGCAEFADILVSTQAEMMNPGSGEQVAREIRAEALRVCASCKRRCDKANNESTCVSNCSADEICRYGDGGYYP